MKPIRPSNERLSVCGCVTLTNSFQPEMTTTPLDPEQFGEWPAESDDEPFPEIAEKRPFDRQRVPDSITERYGA